jgi:hypothetical protein
LNGRHQAGATSADYDCVEAVVRHSRVLQRLCSDEIFASLRAR